MTLKCSYNDNISTYLVPSDTLTELPFDENFLGVCKYNVTTVPLSFFVKPVPRSVTFSIKTTLVQTVTPPVIFSGVPFNIGAYTPQPFVTDLNTRIDLNCSGNVIQTFVVPLNVIVFEPRIKVIASLKLPLVTPHTCKLKFLLKSFTFNLHLVGTSKKYQMTK